LGILGKIKNFLLTVVALLLWLRFIFVIADPSMSVPSDVSEGLVVFNSWRGFLNILYQVTGIAMAPITGLYALLSGFVPKSWSWLPATNSTVLLEWLKSQAALGFLKPMLNQPGAQQFFVGQFQWLVFPTLVFYNILSVVLEKAYEFVKNLIWNILIEFSFTKKKQAAYQETLEKRAADLMKLKVEYRNLSKEASILAESVITDELTQLYNKRFFIQQVQESFKEAKDRKAIFSIVMVDIDHFKKLNDTYGHLMGDKVLKEVAAVVKKNTPKGCYACRFGGEEFSVIMPGRNPIEAHQISETIHTKIPALRYDEDPNLVVTISMGLFSGNFENEQAQALNTFEDVIKLADDELYRAKLNGRNRIEQVRL